MSELNPDQPGGSVAERQVKKCKICGELKIRILKGKFNKKDKKWKSPSGGYWNGHVCPECHRARCAERQRTRRAKPSVSS